MLVDMHLYAKCDQNMPYGSRIMSICTNCKRTDRRKASSIKKGCYTCQWLDNVDMHWYVICDQNMSCDSRIMIILLTANGRTQILIIVQTQGRARL